MVKLSLMNLKLIVLQESIIARKKTEQIKMIKFVCYGKKEEYNQ